MTPAVFRLHQIRAGFRREVVAFFVLVLAILQISGCIIGAQSLPLFKADGTCKDPGAWGVGAERAESGLLSALLCFVDQSYFL